MIQKIILVGRAQAVIYIWYASEGLRHTRHSSSTLYCTMWRYVCTIPHTTPFDALYYTISCDTLHYTISCDTLHYTVPCDTMYYIAQLHHYDTDTGTWCSAKVLAPTKICFIAKISKALSNHQVWPEWSLWRRINRLTFLHCVFNRWPGCLTFLHCVL